MHLPLSPNASQGLQAKKLPWSTSRLYPTVLVQSTQEFLLQSGHQFKPVTLRYQVFKVSPSLTYTD